MSKMEIVMIILMVRPLITGSDILPRGLITARKSALCNLLGREMKPNPCIVTKAFINSGASFPHPITNRSRGTPSAACPTVFLPRLDSVCQVTNQQKNDEESVDRVVPGEMASQEKGHLVIVRGDCYFGRGGDLILLRPDGKEDKSLLKLPSSNIYKGAFPYKFRLSPDRERIAFFQHFSVKSPKLGGLLVVESTGGELLIRDLKANNSDIHISMSECFGYNWCWSPDGQYLALSYLRPLDTYKENGKIENRPQQVITDNWIVDSRRGTKKSISLPRGHVIMDWSRDGKWFLTTSYPHTVKFNNKTDQSPLPLTEANLVSADGKQVHCLSNLKVPSDCGRFSPDCRSVLFITVSTEKAIGQVFVEGLHGERARAITAETDGRILAAVWSPDGKQIAYLWSKSAREWPDARGGKHLDVFLKLIPANGGKPTVMMSEKQHHVELPTLDWR